MGNDTLDTTLFRIDPTQNMARFYSMTIQPNLFGGISLMRNWGRIGSVGQMRCDFFDDADDAVRAMAILSQPKHARGYISALCTTAMLDHGSQSCEEFLELGRQ